MNLFSKINLNCLFVSGLCVKWVLFFFTNKLKCTFSWVINPR